MAFTFSKLASVTVGAGGVTRISFGNIPQNYKDLVIKLSARSSSTDADPKLLCNGVTTGYSRRTITSDGVAGFSSYSASDAWIGTINRSDSPASTFSNTEIYIPNYTSNNNKSYSFDAVTESNVSGSSGPSLAFMNIGAGLFNNTVPITTLSLDSLSGTMTYVQYSTATLYGIRAEV